MNIHLKTKDLEFTAKGDIPKKMVQFLKKEFGDKLSIKEDSKKSKNMTPPEAITYYRKLNKLSQTELGKLMGNIPKQHISNMENGIRGISVPVAKKLSSIFKVSVDTFL